MAACSAPSGWHAARRYRLREPSATVAYRLPWQGLDKKKRLAAGVGLLSVLDRIALVVSKIGVKSLHDIRRRRFRSCLDEVFRGQQWDLLTVIATILSFDGLSFDKNQKLGRLGAGTRRPDAPERWKAIAKRSINAVFDEGVSTSVVADQGAGYWL